jgi:N-acetylmuramoyl-L-alanine amidase
MARGLVLLAFLTAFAVPTGILPIITVAAGDEAEIAQEERQVIRISLAEPTPVATPVIFTPTPHIPRIGIVAGHSGNDSGALCPDGLQEVEINMEIARRVVALLTKRGWKVDLLEEYDSALNEYQADALLSIHADSCTFPGKTGFKVAGAESSYDLRVTQRLVDCVSRNYEERTGLPFDPHTITYDMTHYHAYREIDENTPAAVIETGFLLDDREILTQRPDIVAQGIVDGLVCFIEGEE